MSPLLMVLGFMAAANLGLDLFVLKAAGPVGAAWVLLFSMGAGSIALLHFASSGCGTVALRILGSASRGLWLPAATCAVVASLPARFASEPARLTLAVTVLVALLFYALTLLRVGARAEERRFILGLPHTVWKLLSTVGNVLRRSIGSRRFVRSGWALIIAIYDLVHDCYGNAASFDAEYQRDLDPWKYDSPEGRRRFIDLLCMIEDLTGAELFRNALEIGCSEGVFTQMLAKHCRSLLAVDFAAVALDRARHRCGSIQNVTFLQWDLRRDVLGHQYDLIVVMDVLSYIFRPAALKAARLKLVGGLREGGYLLFGDVRQSTIFEQSCWNKYLMRGGMRIRELLASDNLLETVTVRTTDTHVFALFRKVS
jgi:SAM-dependent methyltransferase